MWIGIISISVLEVFAVVIAFLTSGGRKMDDSKAGLKVLGKLEDISFGSVTPYRSDRLYLIRMEDGGLLALSLKCTHLGCAVGWNKETDEFDCPCHASSFNMMGEVISPPAPRPLDIFPLQVHGGLLKVDLKNPKSRKKFDKSQLTYA